MIGSPSYSAATDASGKYSVSIPAGTWYARALATNYFTSAAQTVTVISAPATNINFALVAGTRNIPRTTNLLFSAVTDTLPASREHRQLGQLPAARSELRRHWLSRGRNVQWREMGE